MGLHLATITRAMAAAEQRGLVTSRQGQATFVSGAANDVSPGKLDLTLNLPPEPADGMLPRKLAETTARLLKGDGAHRMLRYPVLGGAEVDRRAGARWIAGRGVEVDAGGVVLADGADHAVLLALMALGPGRERVLSESLAYPGLRTMTALLGIPLEGLPTDGDGLLPDAFAEAASRGPAVLALTPTLHNPTTRTMPTSRRREVVAVARQHGVVIIEDDVYGALPESSPPPFAALAPECTAYLTSFSKSFAPGLRVGYLASSDAMIAERLGVAARAMTCTPPTLTARVASRWVEDGTALDALAAARVELRERDTICSKVLTSGVKGHGTMSPHRWLELEPGWRRAEFVERADRMGVQVRASDAFAVTNDPPEAVRFSISAPPDIIALEQSLLILARALREPRGVRRAVV